MLIRLNWCSDAVYKVGIDRIQLYVADSMRMIELHRILNQLGCKFKWDSINKKLLIVAK